MDNSVSQIKEALDIVQVIEGYVPLKQTGKNYSARCPFHQEKTPSFVVSKQKQIFRCFGCGVGGNVFEFYKNSQIFFIIFMNAKSFINKIASTHPNVLAKKLVKKSSMVVIDFFAEFLDRKYGTYFIGKTKFIAKEFVLDEHSLDNDAIITFADNICEHRFRFLGIKNCNLNLKDKSININYSNYYKSEAIESLIVGIYRKIKWHSDFNTKYNWNTDVWYKKIKFGNFLIFFLWLIKLQVIANMLLSSEIYA